MDNENILFNRLSYFIEAIEKSLADSNWFAALTLALTVPDICGRLSFHDQTSSSRYISWFDSYIKEKYKMEVMGETHIFLTGNDAYALRCSFLHQGDTDISEQKIRETLSKFEFSIPTLKDRESKNNHCLIFRKILMIRVDIFCLDIVDGVKIWIKGNESKVDVIERAQKLACIKDSEILIGTKHIG